MIRKVNNRSRRYVEFLSGLEFEYISIEATHQAKRSILDCSGVAIAASAEPQIR